MIARARCCTSLLYRASVRPGESLKVRNQPQPSAHVVRLRHHRRTDPDQLGPWRPALIISSKLWFGDEEIGAFNQPNVDEFRKRLVHERLLDSRPHAATLGGHPFLDAGLQRFLLSVDSYDKDVDGEFARLIEGQLRLEIEYESIYGERFTAVYPDRERASSPPC